MESKKKGISSLRKQITWSSRRQNPSYKLNLGSRAIEDGQYVTRIRTHKVIEEDEFQKLD